jgi:hypothetical protein
MYRKIADILSISQKAWKFPANCLYSEWKNKLVEENQK